MFKEKKINILLYIFLLLYIIFNITWIIFDPLIGGFQFTKKIIIFDTNLEFGIDGINFFFIYLTNLLIILSLIYTNTTKYKYNEKIKHKLLIFNVGLLLLISFSTLDMLIFYISFELILIPFFIYIGISGYRNRRIHASLLFFLYTLFGSFFLIISLLILYLQVGDFSYENLWNIELLENKNIILWWFLFIAFAVKIPMYPFYIWLPEAHVEAPTQASVLLAGLLLKLGIYGMLRFLLPIFNELNYYFSNFVNTLAIISVIFASFSTLKQIDIKKIIAYSSIAHMNMCIIGIYTFNDIAIVGSIYLMIAHGIVSGGLFFLIGMLYNRFNTKLLNYFSGIIYNMPLLSFFMFLFVLGNIALPGTSNFIGEILILKGIIYLNQKIGIIVIILNILFCTIYSMWFYNRIIYLLPKFNWLIVVDLNFTEYFIMKILTFYLFFFGLFPNYTLNIIDSSILFNYIYILL